MEKMKVIEMIHAKIDAVSFNDNGLATVSLKDIGDSDLILSALEVLKTDTPYEYDFNLDDMSLKIYNQTDDLDGYIKRHPSPQKCQ